MHLDRQFFDKFELGVLVFLVIFNGCICVDLLAEHARHNHAGSELSLLEETGTHDGIEFAVTAAAAAARHHGLLLDLA